LEHLLTKHTCIPINFQHQRLRNRFWPRPKFLILLLKSGSSLYVQFAIGARIVSVLIWAYLASVARDGLGANLRHIGHLIKHSRSMLSERVFNAYQLGSETYSIAASRAKSRCSIKASTDSGARISGFTPSPTKSDPSG